MRLRAPGATRAELTLPLRAPREEHAGNVGTGRQTHERHRAEEHPNLPSDIPRHLEMQAAHQKCLPRIRLWIQPGEAATDRLHLAIGLSG